MIQVSNNGNNRARTWHWFKNGILAKRTLIDEVKLTKDWSDFDGKILTMRISLKPSRDYENLSSSSLTLPYLRLNTSFM